MAFGVFGLSCILFFRRVTVFLVYPLELSLPLLMILHVSIDDSLPLNSIQICISNYYLFILQILLLLLSLVR